MLAQQALLGLMLSALSASTDPALTGATLTRQRRRAVPADVGRAVNVRLVRSDGEQVVIGPVDWSTVVAVEYIARSGAASSPDEAVGPMTQAGHSALMAADAALRAAGFDLLPAASLVWDEEDMDDRIGACTAVYTTRHRTPFNDI